MAKRIQRARPFRLQLPLGLLGSIELIEHLLEFGQKRGLVFCQLRMKYQVTRQRGGIFLREQKLYSIVIAGEPQRAQQLANRVLLIL